LDLVERGRLGVAELLANVGVELGDPEIWNDGFAVLKGLVERMRSGTARKRERCGRRLIRDRKLSGPPGAA
jgi:hypothetical protein